MFLKSKNILLCLIILFIAAAAVSNYNLDFWTIRRNFEPIKYQKHINYYSQKFSINPDLLAALIYVESRFEASSKSNQGAVGLMQLMPSTAMWVARKLEKKDFELDDLYDPKTNIELGSWYFSYLRKKFNGDLIKTLAAYNAGEGNVNNWLKNDWNGKITVDLPYGETDNFVKRVISTRDHYQKRSHLLLFPIKNLFKISSLIKR